MPSGDPVKAAESSSSNNAQSALIAANKDTQTTLVLAFWRTYSSGMDTSPI